MGSERQRAEVIVIQTLHAIEVDAAPATSAHPQRVLRVAHLATVPFRPEEGVSRAVTSLAGLMPGVESHLIADNPVGSEFAGHHQLRNWNPVKVLASGQLDSVLRSLKPDVVHLHGGILASSLALSSALRRVPVVATVYQLLPVPRTELGFQQFFDARRSSIRPGRIAASALAGLPLARGLLKRGGIEVVCTPDPRVAAALDRYGPVIMVQGGASVSLLQAQWSVSPVVGFAGRAEQGRGVEELVEAVGLLRRDFPKIKLRLMLLPGPAAERWTSTYGTESHIELSVGVKSDLSAELASCHVVALPFRIPATITPPLVAAEAMAVGVPVVANSLSCITPLISDGRNGMLAADSSAASLACAIGKVLKDRATWDSLSAGARETIATEWSWANAADATARAYGAALDRRETRRGRGD